MIKNLFLLLFIPFVLHANSSTYFGFGYLNPQNPALISAITKNQHHVSIGTHIIQNDISTLGISTFAHSSVNLQTKYAYRFKKHTFFIANDESIIASSEDKLYRSDAGTLSKTQQSNSFTTLDYAYTLHNTFSMAMGISYDLQGTISKTTTAPVILNKFFLNNIDATLTYKTGFLHHGIIAVGGYLGLEQTFYTTKVGNIRPKIHLSLGTTTSNTLKAELTATYSAQNYTYATNDLLASSFLPRTFETSTTVQSKVDTFFLGVSYGYTYLEPLLGSKVASYKNELTAFAEGTLENKASIYLSLGFQAHLQEGILSQSIHATIALFTTIKQKKRRKRIF